MIEQVPCENQNTCRLSETKRGCFMDVHHRMFPRAAYRTPVEKEFRQLDENKVLMCREQHNEIHATTEPPDMPCREIMMMAIDEQKNKRLGILE